MFVFVFMWAVIASTLAALFYARISEEKEKSLAVQKKMDELAAWHDSSRPVNDLQDALYKAATLERENEDLKEKLDKLTFEKEELEKELSSRPHRTITYYNENIR